MERALLTEIVKEQNRELQKLSTGIERKSAYLIFTLDKYAFSIRDQTISYKKAYTIDTGFMETIGFQFSKNSGKYLENIVSMDELKLNEGWIIILDHTEIIKIDKKRIHCVSIINWLLS